MDNAVDITASIIQAALLVVLVIWAARHIRDSWLFTIIFSAFGCYLLGMVFWVLHYFVMGDWPRGFSASDVSFLGYFCFLIAAAVGLLGQLGESARAQLKRQRILALIGPLTVVLFHSAYLLLAGGLVNNLLYCLIMAVLAYYNLLGLLAAKKGLGGSWRRYYRVMLVLMGLELLMFLVSSFGWDVLYYVFCTLEATAWFFIIPAAEKGMTS